MEKRELLYEGESKRIYTTHDPQLVILEYKDDATAVVNNRVNSFLLQMVAEYGVPTHYVKEQSDRGAVVVKLDVIPLEVIIRNDCGTGAEPAIMFRYKKGDAALLDAVQALALGVASAYEINRMMDLALRVNDVLSAYFERRNIELADIKLEFGRMMDGFIVLADEISLDTCTLCDAATHENICGKDYNEIMYRIFGEQC